MQELLDFARHTAATASARLLERFRSGDLGKIRTKRSITDLVTDVDQEIEELVVSAIQKEFPGHAILAEEEGVRAGDDQHLWILDPLDGTKNFVHGFPVFGVSLGYLEDGHRQVGVVDAPALAEQFSAARGLGAWRNGEPIRVSTASSLDGALLATGFGCVREGVRPDNVGALVRILRRCHDIRRAGSAALDLCFVASGRLDGFWERNLSPWDVAAGTLIIEEAGGVVTDFQAGPDFLYGKSLVAANPTLQAQLLEEVLAAFEKWPALGAEEPKTNDQER